ncbi:MAG: methionine--tRNA ligase subunit beta [Candidatus Micrarchaeota archaeon]
MGITYEDFAKLELVVGTVESAELVPGADKLLKLSVDLGSEKRQLVAGLAPWYSTEQIVGKKIIVLANLEPKMIRGLESKGMLLAADSPDVSLLTVDKDVPAGTKVR